jgi:HEPN domain-containing protein
MPPELLPDEEVVQWLRHAERDLALAEWATKAPFDTLGEVLFHSQQAVEKALKCYLISRRHPFPKTHDLDLLLSQCAGYDRGFAQLDEATSFLKPYASRSRYPDEQPIPEEVEAVKVLTLAAGVVHFVKDRL